jgi:hypothetical protein
MPDAPSGRRPESLQSEQPPFAARDARVPSVTSPHRVEEVDVVVSERWKLLLFAVLAACAVLWGSRVHAALVSVTAYSLPDDHLAPGNGSRYRAEPGTGAFVLLGLGVLRAASPKR